MDLLNPKTFDLGAVLAGLDYPEKVVDVYFDETLAYEVSKMKKELELVAALNDEKYDEAQKKFDELVEKLASLKYQFHLKAIPTSVKNDIDARVEEEYPEEFNAVGLPQQNKKRDELFACLMMEAHITKIVAPDGAEIVSPSLDTIRNFRKNAPPFALSLIESEIIAFRQNISIGFEVAAKSADFLSKP